MQEKVLQFLVVLFEEMMIWALCHEVLHSGNINKINKHKSRLNIPNWRKWKVIILYNIYFSLIVS